MKLSSAEIEYIRYARNQGISYIEILDSVSSTDIEDIVNTASNEVSVEVDLEPINDKPWLDESLVHNLYVERDMMITEISAVLNCEPSKVKTTVDKYIPSRLTVFVDKYEDIVSLDVGQTFKLDIAKDSEFLQDENIDMYQDSMGSVRFDAYKIHKDATRYLSQSSPTISSDESSYLIFPPGYTYMSRIVEQSGLSMGRINGQSFSGEDKT